MHVALTMQNFFYYAAALSMMIGNLKRLFPKSVYISLVHKENNENTLFTYSS